MIYNPKKHHRKSIRLPGYDYSEAGWYFVTICVHNRECLFGKIQKNKMVQNNLGLIVEMEWNKTSQLRQNINLDEYIIMPNHIHGIIHIKNHIAGATRWVDLNDNNKDRATDPIAIATKNSNPVRTARKVKTIAP